MAKPRRDALYRPVDERVRDFRPVEIGLSLEEAREQAARCMGCGTPFCHAKGCPLGNQIPEWNELAARGRYRDALELLLSTNNFPELTSEVCPALCEGSCVLGLTHEPVSIRLVERAIIEEGFRQGWVGPRPPATRRQQSVAVIGSGPAGLAVADTLNKMGYNVTVFDEAAKPGGILRYGIPEFKLAKAVVDRRLKLMEDEGVRFETGVRVGEDLSYRYLRDRFAAVCLTTGAREPRELDVPGRDLEGVHQALEYLSQQNRRLAGEQIPAGEAVTAQGKTVVVIGGGDTGSDCLGTAIRQGARQVTQLEILPEPPRTRSPATPWPEWPHLLRSSSSHKEGGERRWSVCTRELLGEEGRVRALRGYEVRWDRRVMTEKPGTDFELEADLVLLAMGFVGPRRNRIVEDLKLQTGPGGVVRRDEHSMTSLPGIFVAGDVSSGATLVVRAIADGRRAAHGIAGVLGVGSLAPRRGAADQGRIGSD